ncbi:GntR family transcriptional regulator [Antrihabitans cavernicola]|uniref:GntR family transcriptional regulator n=1 Tax=Antrihabitans cavernicola TaxID=2495913 RepID=A0A5A7S7T6_9NOCA|nr:GntR family transcriptional regulator [Spelaeibacter cavernicola]KAA0021212.1 GntR family transcriptional regulator [Spelaeibacter cavernicola]
MASPVAPDAYTALAAQRDQLDRASRSERIADIVRRSILDGTFAPGTRLSEPDICAALGVSRNTLREAFRTLVEERLATHELNRGVFVRIPTAVDVADLYSCRRIVERAALRDLSHDADLGGLSTALDTADSAAQEGDWTGVGSADIAFHKAIAALNRSVRLDQLMADVWNELRLVFHVMADPHRFHQPYLERNHRIYDAAGNGNVGEAEQMLTQYLADAERQILAAYPAAGR